MALVLDASVAVAWCLPDESSASAIRVLDLVRKSHALVPAIWPVELANALVNAQLRGRANATDLSTFFQLLDGLVIQIAPSLRTDTAKLHKLAVESGLTVYDASYLALALESNLPIATFDQKILRAAKAYEVRNAFDLNSAV